MSQRALQSTNLAMTAAWSSSVFRVLEGSDLLLNTTKLWFSPFASHTQTIYTSFLGVTSHIFLNKTDLENNKLRQVAQLPNPSYNKTLMGHFESSFCHQHQLKSELVI